MTPAPAPCPECGARPKSTSALHCEYCGSVLRSPPPIPAAPAPHSPSARFAALEAHPAWPELVAYAPTGRMVEGTYGLSIGFATFFAVLCIGMAAYMAIAVDGPVFALVPLGMAAVALWAAARARKRLTAFRAAPLERGPRLIVDGRTEHRSNRHGHGRTEHYVTIQDPGGARADHRVPRDLARRLAPGDLGMAYLKGEHLIEFRAVPDV